MGHCMGGEGGAYRPAAHTLISRDLSSVPPGRRAVLCALSHPVNKPHQLRRMQKVGGPAGVICHLLSSQCYGLKTAPEGSPDYV